MKKKVWRKWKHYERKFSNVNDTLELCREKFLFCLEREMRHILASVRHPQTNGKVERKMSIVKEYLMKFGYPEIRIPNIKYGIR